MKRYLILFAVAILQSVNSFAGTVITSGPHAGDCAVRSPSGTTAYIQCGTSPGDATCNANGTCQLSIRKAAGSVKQNMSSK